MADLFRIVRASPIHCGITDGIIGTSYRALPMTYNVEALARKLAGRMEQAHYDACGDDAFFVTKCGEPLHRPRPVPFETSLDDMPF